MFYTDAAGIKQVDTRQVEAVWKGTGGWTLYRSKDLRHWLVNLRVRYGKRVYRQVSNDKARRWLIENDYL